MNNKKTVFISGCNRGIGKSTAIYFASHGWNVIFHARNKSDDCNRLIAELKSFGTEVIPVFFDMCDETVMKTQIKQYISNPKITIDAIVNNAGIMELKMFMLTSVSVIREVFEVNLFSHMRLTQLLLKRMKNGGTITNVSSIDGLYPNQGESAYASSKAAMLTWTEILSKELKGYVRVNAIAPAAVETDMSKRIEANAPWKGHELISPDEIAKTIFFLSNDESQTINGAVIKINRTN